ncbi:MAG: glycoside hydrolase [Bacteroidales bacterium]|jgi:hypothetical protein|nr:glycoside hydrolase [Bacteroidales bacterium]
MKKNSLLLFLLFFSCTLYAEVPWKAVWISHETSQSVPNQWLCYRKVVNVPSVPGIAVARIAADSKYWLWINGKMVVFEGGLKRGPAPGETYYDEVDVAPFLQAGDNTIAALVWYFGKNGFSHASSGRAGFLFDCQASGVEILTDASWNCDTYRAYQNTGEPHPNYRMPESNIRFDARLEIGDWYLPGQNKIHNPAMRVGDADVPPFGKLVKRPIPHWKDFGLKEYPEMKKSGDTLLCRLPYNAQVTPWFRINASQPGLTVGMITDNYTTGNGRTYSVRAEYITREGVQEYENLGWMSGHVVKYIIPSGVEVLEVKYRETGYNADFTGSFQCNDPFLNELWKRSARTLYVNMRDTYFDCPERERAQWWGDVVNELGQTFYAMDPRSHQLTRKAILELMNWQRADGVIYSPVPAGNWTKELPLQMLASVGWYGFYAHYFYSGDDSFIPLIYDRLHRYLHDVWQIDGDGLVKFRHGDWSWSDSYSGTDDLVMTNSWYYMALKAEREFARILGKTADVKEITSLMEGIEKSFDKRFWTGTAYRSPDFKGADDDRAQALAVVSGLASKDKYPALVKVLKKEFHSAPYMERFIIDALFMMDEPVFALERMKSRYANMMSYDFTTLFEVWNFKSAPNDQNTNNHAWTGWPIITFGQKVCGVEPVSPGFRHFRITPQMGNLTEATTVVPSVLGDIHVSVERKGKNLKVTALVPSGTTAEVCFPSGKCVSLTPGTHTVKGK